MQIFIAKSARALSIVVIFAMALALVGIHATDGISGVLLSTPLVLLISYLSLMLFWLPRVEVSETEVLVKNVLRSYRVPIGAVARIDTRWNLTLFIEGGKKISSWSATAPGRHASIFASRDQGQHLPETTYLDGTVRPGDLISTDSGAAAATIRRHWESRKQEGGEVKTSWHYSQLTIFASLLVLNFLVLS